MPIAYLATDKEFQAFVSSNPIVLVNYTASWCGPCKAVSPQVEELATKYPKVKFIKIDIDQNEDTPTKFNINAVPTFHLVHNGRVVGEVTGANFPKIKALVEQGEKM